MAETKHQTASVLMISTGVPKKVLLLHHRKLDRWMYPGGHQEPNENGYETAIREAIEETGIDISDLLPRPQTIDEHSLFLPMPKYILEEHISPAPASQPDHYHIDSVYAVHVPEQPVRLEAEGAYEAKWFTLEETKPLKLFNDLRAIIEQELS